MDKLLEKKINKEFKTGNVKSAIELCQIGLQNDPTNGGVKAVGPGAAKQ